MGTLSFVTQVAITMVLLALVPVGWVLARESRRRRAERRAAQQEERAIAMIGAAADGGEATLRALERAFDVKTLERALVRVVRDRVGDPRHTELFRRLGITARYLRRVREARAWSERAQTAEVLGLLGEPAACVPLVAVLRDEFEDATVKRAASDALGRIRSPEVVPLLVKELETGDAIACPRVAEALVAFGETAAAPVAALLASERPAARAWAARVLGRIGSTTPLAALTRGLGDAHEAVRAAVAEALGHIGDRRAAATLVEATLRDPAASVRAEAARALGRLGDERAVEVLTAALADPDYAARVRALEALEALRPETTEPLQRALRDPSPDVRRRAAMALERVGYLERCIERIASSDAEEAARAYEAVLELGRAGLVEGIGAYARHADARVRAHVMAAAAALGEARLGETAAEAARDPDAGVRARAADALGALAPEGARDVLLALAEDAEPAVVDAAAAALARVGLDDPKAVVLRLIAAYERGTHVARASLVELIAGAGGEPAARVVVDAADDPDEGVRARAVQCLPRFVEWTGLGPLAARLVDPSVAVRLAAIAAMGEIRTEASLEALLRSLRGAGPEVREAIAQALSTWGFAALRDAVSALATSPEIDVRLGVAWTLGKTGEPGGVALLAKLLRDREGRVRASAAGALGKIACAETLRALVAAADDPDPRARAAIVNALARVSLARLNAKGSARANGSANGSAGESASGGAGANGSAGAGANGSASARRGATASEVGDADASEVTEATSALRERLADPDAFVRSRALIGLALVLGPRAEADVDRPELAPLVDPAALTVAMGLLGTDAWIGRTTARLSEDDAHEAAVRALLEREPEAVRRAYARRMRLPEPASGETPAGIEGMIAHWQGLVRTGHDAADRRAAVAALTGVRTTASVEALAGALAGDPSEEVRLAAAIALAERLDEEPARAALARAVLEPSAAVGRVVLDALGRARDRRSADTLFARLGASARALEDAVEEALARIHADDPAPFVARLEKAARAETRIAGVRVLARMLEGGSAPLAASPAARPERRAAVDCVEPALVACARADVPGVRAAAVTALGRLSSEAAMAAVDGALEDAHLETRLAAMDAIVAQRPASAAGRLARVLLDPTPAARRRLAELVEKLSVTSAEEVLDALLGDPAAEVRAAAMATVLARGAEGVVRFAALVASADGDARAALPSDRRAAGLSELAGRLVETHASADVRKAAVEALAALRADGHDEWLAKALSDPVPAVRIAAIRALAATEEAKLRERIQAMLQDPDHGVREAAQRSNLRLVR